MTLFGQEVSSDAAATLLDQLPVLILGVIVALGFITEKVVSGKTYEASLDREEKLAEENAALRSALEDRVLPALIKNGSVTEQAITALGATSTALDRATTRLQESDEIIGAVVPALDEAVRPLEDLPAVVQMLRDAAGGVVPSSQEPATRKKHP